jgi:hypothetical protein
MARGPETAKRRALEHPGGSLNRMRRIDPDHRNGGDRI